MGTTNNTKTNEHATENNNKNKAFENKSKGNSLKESEQNHKQNKEMKIIWFTFIISLIFIVSFLILCSIDLFFKYSKLTIPVDNYIQSFLNIITLSLGYIWGKHSPNN